MVKFNWDCWNDTTTPPTTSTPTTSTPATSIPVETDTTCYAPRIETVLFVPTLNIEVYFIK